MDHCAAVTRVYALYEQFVQELLREYLNVLEQYHPFTELPKAFQAAYRGGVAKILERIDGPRYQHIILSDLLEQFHLAVASSPEYRLEPMALLTQEQNLRLNILGSLFQNCGIENLAGWIATHPDTIAFFAQDRMHPHAESELAALIQFRNEAAHSGLTIDSVLSVDALCEFADFISVLCSVLSERVQQTSISNGQTKQFARKCGAVTEVFRSGAIVVVNAVGVFEVGKNIYFSSDSSCVELLIMSLQIQGVDVESHTSTSSEEIGIGLNGRAKVGQVVFQLIEQTAVDSDDDVIDPIVAE